VQYDSVLGVVHQSEDVRATFAEPEMLHAVMVLRRIRRRAIRDFINFAGPEAEEFSAAEPVKSV
jgi:hypothetical protein